MIPAVNTWAQVNGRLFMIKMALKSCMRSAPTTVPRSLTRPPVRGVPPTTTAVMALGGQGLRERRVSQPEDTLKKLGVDVAVDYTSEYVFEVALDDTGGEGVDAVLDTAGGDLIAKSVQATRLFGRLAGIVSLQGDLTPAYRLNQTIYGVFLTRERRRLDEMSRLIERGQVRPLVDEVLPLNEVAKAHERLESGHGGGKVVLRVAGE